MNHNYHQNSDENPLCPRCRVGHLKTWQELTDDEKLLATKMPLSAEYTSDERKRHLFCPKCWYEINNAAIKA